jgi:hypothetical protein
MTLQQGLGNPRSQAEIAINLEWRMRIEEIVIETSPSIYTGIVKEAGEHFIHSVTIAQTRPEVYFPSP